MFYFMPKNVLPSSIYRTHAHGILIHLHDFEPVFLSLPSASSIYLLTALNDITGIGSHLVEHSSVVEFSDNDDMEPVVPQHDRNFSIFLPDQRTSFSVSDNWLVLFHSNGTIIWREDLCKVGHFIQFGQNLIGVTSISADLLLQLQAVAEWVLVHCNVVIPVTLDTPNADRFLLTINASHFFNIESSVAALHQAAVAFRKSKNCSSFNYGYDELKKCANSLPRNETFNATLFMNIFEPFAVSSKKFTVHNTSCPHWDSLPRAAVRSPSVAGVLDIWVSCMTYRRVLALSKSAIMSLSLVSDSACELQAFCVVFIFCYSFVALC
jgi:hypothetical protein